MIAGRYSYVWEIIYIGCEKYICLYSPTSGQHHTRNTRKTVKSGEFKL